MDSSNNNFKSFDDNQTELPQGFGWEDMKEGVYEKMPTPKKRRRRVVAWWWFGSAGILALSFAAWILLSENSAHVTVAQSNQTTTASDDAPKKNSATKTSKDIALSESTESSTTISDDVPNTHPSNTPLQSTNIEAKADLADQLVSNTINESQNLSADKARSNRTNERNTAPNDMALATPTTGSVLDEGEAYVVIPRGSNLARTKVTPSSSTTFPVQTDKPQANSAASTIKEPRSSSPPTLRKNLLVLTELQPQPDEHIATQLAEEKPNSIEVISLTPAKSVNLPHLSLHNLFNPKTPVQAGNFVFLETFVSIPTSKINPTNAAYTSPWYSLGQNIGYKRQMKNRFGFSAQYSHLILKQEFAFSDVDTITFQQNTSQHPINYVNSDLTLLTSTTVTAETLFERQREVLSYNEYEINQFSLYAHYMFPFDEKRNLDLGLGGSIAFLKSAEGILLDGSGELAFITNFYDFGNNRFGSVNARLNYFEQVSPKLAWRLGFSYMHAMRGNSIRSIDMMNSVSFLAGAQWKF